MSIRRARQCAIVFTNRPEDGLPECGLRFHAQGVHGTKILTGINRDALHQGKVGHGDWRCCKTCKGPARCSLPQMGGMVKGPARKTREWQGA